METMQQTVAKNVRRLREERGLSLDELARRSGVSKSMLAQIERGDGNPTLSTLWKLSNGMQVPFDALTVRRKSDCERVRTEEIEPLLEDGGRVRNYPIFPDDGDRRFAVYYLELEPGSSWQSEPHLRGTMEFITVFAGSIEIETAGRRLTVRAGEHVRFRGDAPHAYRSTGGETAVLHMILSHP